MSIRVVIAPNTFKGSLTAVDAAEAMARGVTDAVPDARIQQCPIADGGEGTLDVVLGAGARRVELCVRGPLEDRVPAEYAILDDVAYIESARACGIEFVRPAPATAVRAHTFGVGELIAHALDGGAKHIVLTVGGTASTDGGAGMLVALGAELRDGWGTPTELGGGPLGMVEHLDLRAVTDRISGIRVGVATDVTNPLIGDAGAAAVFAAQKGAAAAEITLLERSLRNWSRLLVGTGGAEVATTAGAGAGGGLAAGAMVGLGAQFESGFELVAGLTNLDQALAEADLVLTGEGSLDAQSLDGKAPASLAGRASTRGVPVLALSGRVQLEPARLREAGIVASTSLLEHAISVEHAQREADILLRTHAAELVRHWIATAG